ncbi:MAG: alanine racemase [Oscillospiraceae bacterium]|nr:alanine racemase [Oscillospiraceae bacterium]
MHQPLRAWAEISLGALAHNLREIRRLTAPSRLMAMVKADAYGHGAVAVSQQLCKLEVDYFGVASIDEAMELRTAGIETPILIMGMTPPHLAPLLVENALSQTVYDSGSAQAMSRAAAGGARPLRVHLKVDTGMSRLGVVWRGEETLSELLSLCRLPHLLYEGLFTHLSASEDPNDPLNMKQLSDFASIRKGLAAEGINIPIYHCANSGAVIQFNVAYLDMVRAGLLLYGLTPGEGLPFDGRPVMTFKSRIAQVKEIPAGASVSYGHTYTAHEPRRVAVVSAGYADGYHRRLSNKAHVLIAGRRAPVLGTVCMDMMVVDVTGIPQAQAGDPVVLFGPDRDGATGATGATDAIPVDELASLAGTISYELICAVSKRVPRVYIG